MMSYQCFTVFVTLSICSVAQCSGKFTFQPDQCANIKKIERVDCHPERGASSDGCYRRSCCWVDQHSLSGVPMCFFPPNYPSYVINSSCVTGRHTVAELTKSETIYSKDEIKHVRLEVTKETKSRLRFRFTIPSQPDRWEPPIPLGKPDDVEPRETDYDVQLDKCPFGIKVTRNDEPNQILIDSTGSMASSLIISDQFLQITFRIYADHTYGPGELVSQFPHKLNEWIRTGLWAHDGQPVKNGNLYGTHNFILGQSHDGTAFGLFLLNSNAQEVVYTPLPTITYRTIGGILDFFLLTGPKPADVVAQYYDLIGHPPIPPYWSLGFHLCRYGAKSIDDIATILKRNLDAKIPIDVQWFDIDYMDAYKDWTVDMKSYGKMNEFIQNTIKQQNGMKSVVIVDPAISTKGGNQYRPYIDGVKLGIFINDSRTGKPILGKVWPGETVFPDFSHPMAEQWWYDSAKLFHEQIPFDGLWIDMNEPANFVAGSLTGCPPNNKLDNPPFVPRILEQSLFSKTVCPSALHHNSTHYDRHNLYGYDQARVTNHVLKRLFPNKRPFVLSRSTFAGSGRYAYHWTGDVESTWNDLRVSLTQLINFNIFGMPMIGADICGFNGDTTEELCVRWHQLGAFYPFARNHNSDSSRAQDPAVWSPQAVEAIRDVLNLRYYLLPYIYSLFFRAHMNGSMVIRALSFEFPDELGTHEIQSQFMLGPCVLVTPVLEEGRTSVIGYVPAGEWINLSTGKRIVSRGELMYFSAPLNIIPILVRAGCVLTIQAKAISTSLARKSGFNLLIVLSSVDDGSDNAEKSSSACGELFWDDGENANLDFVHFYFIVQCRTLSVTARPSNRHVMNDIDPSELLIHSISILGFTKSPTSLIVNGKSVRFLFLDEYQLVSIPISNTLSLKGKVEIHWKF